MIAYTAALSKTNLYKVKSALIIKIAQVRVTKNITQKSSVTDSCHVHVTLTRSGDL